jgi:nucleotidyltransferase DUF2204
VKPLNWKKLGIREAAAAVCSHLQGRGIEASLVGGGCVSIYSDNAYESLDLDFVSHEPQKKIEAALAEIGFKKRKEDISIIPTADSMPNSYLRQFLLAAN